jgi:hypothetical protein
LELLEQETLAVREARYREASPNIAGDGGIAEETGSNDNAPTKIAQLNK